MSAHRAPLSAAVAAFAALAASACGPGVPGEVIAEGERYALGLTRGGDTLYWFGASSVYAVSKDGGEVRTLAEGQHPVTALGLSDRVCWVDLEGEYRLRCVPEEGGEVEELAVEPAQTAIVRNLAADEVHLYWANAAGEVRRVPLDGGEVETFARTDTAAASLAVDAEFVYSSAVGGIVRFQKTDAAVDVVVGGAVVIPQGFALGVGEDRSIYWVEMSPLGTDAIILTAAVSGSSAGLLAQNEVFPSDLAVDDAHVYWGTGYSDAHIRRVPLAVGGRVEDFASGTRISGAPILHEGLVYWLDYEGRLHRAPR